MFDLKIGSTKSSEVKKKTGCSIGKLKIRHKNSRSFKTSQLQSSHQKFEKGEFELHKFAGFKFS